jgi:hypothetical protein
LLGLDFVTCWFVTLLLSVAPIVARLDRMDTRLDQMDARLDVISARLANLSQRCQSQHPSPVLIHPLRKVVPDHPIGVAPADPILAALLPPGGGPVPVGTPFAATFFPRDGIPSHRLNALTHAEIDDMAWFFNVDFPGVYFVLILLSWSFFSMMCCLLGPLIEVRVESVRQFFHG